ncbi:MAG: tRNA pseudouridine(38-40) synthase TruA [bacterium]
MKNRYKVTISYDGTAYSGYQVQPGHPTIQSVLEDALEKLTGAAIRVFGSGRTDQGVHARGQVIHFDLPKPFDPMKLRIGMNAHLPADVRVESARKARADFNARKSAKEKEYRYFIWNSPVLTPDVRFHRTHVWKPLDVKAMRLAAKRLEGRHDFAAFSANPRREVEGTVRTLKRLQVKKAGPDVVIIARGDGFLYKMVRSLAGFLIRVGTGEIEPGAAAGILESKTRTARVPTAPPQGLFLWRVWY